jgi:hypothetical protein
MQTSTKEGNIDMHREQECRTMCGVYAHRELHTTRRKVHCTRRCAGISCLSAQKKHGGGGLLLLLLREG